MKKFIIGFGLLTIAAMQHGTAHASDAFASVDQAASAALHEIMPTSASEVIEYAGCLYEQKGKVFYTVPETSSEARGFNIHCRFPQSAKLVGIFHTHPGDEETNEVFSQPDVEVAVKLGLPSYIGITRSSSIKRFIAGKDKTSIIKYAGTFLATAKGTII